MKTKYLMIVAIAVSASAIFSSCKSTATIQKVNNEQEITVPCDDYFSDANFFRGQGVAQSKDLNTAREKARMAANMELAGSISTFVSQVSERYVNDAGQSPADYSETFEALGRQVVSQQLSNIQVACNKTMRTQDNMYKVYMAIEADRKKVFDALDKEAATDKKFRTLYDREKFRAIYESELETFVKKQE